MTTLKVTVKRPKSDGLYTVYIRVTHARKSVYVNTNKVVDAAHISDSGEPTDPVVKEHCSRLVREYMDRLNRVDTSCWVVKEVLVYLQESNQDICFSDYAREFIRKIASDGHERNAKNYRL